MLLSEGDTVKYKHVEGVIAFVSDHYLSILVNRGRHKSQDVRIVVYKSDFSKIEKLIEK